MSRNKAVDYTKYVHEFVDKNGDTRYAVAEWNARSGHYEAPLDKRTAKLTGCQAEFGPLTYLGGYKTRTQALRRARYLWGPGEDNIDYAG